jgi:hypothetical protein
LELKVASPPRALNLESSTPALIEATQRIVTKSDVRPIRAKLPCDRVRGFIQNMIDDGLYATLMSPAARRPVPKIVERARWRSRWERRRLSPIRAKGFGTPQSFVATSIGGERRMQLLFGRQNSLFKRNLTLIRTRKFPVPLRREFKSKALKLLRDWPPKSRQRARIDDIPCYFPC